MTTYIKVTVNELQTELRPLYSRNCWERLYQPGIHYMAICKLRRCYITYIHAMCVLAICIIWVNSTSTSALLHHCTIVHHTIKWMEQIGIVWSVYSGMFLRETVSSLWKRMWTMHIDVVIAIHVWLLRHLEPKHNKYRALLATNTHFILVCAF